MTVHAVMAFSLFSALGATISGSVGSGSEMDPALLILGKEIGEALAFDRVLGVMARIFVLWLGLKSFDSLVPRAARWRLGIAHSLEEWAPTVRLTVAGLMAVVVIDAVTPEEPQARALVAAAVILTVLWSAQAVLRNAAAGAVIIVRRAVRVGEHLRIGEIAGRVTSVTLRGVELEDADGSRSFVPGLLLHTETTTHGPSGVRASAVEMTWRPSLLASERDPEELRGLARRLALLSPRRAPGTPVLVHRHAETGDLRITLTPYDRAESDALRLEVTRRLAEAFAPTEPPSTVVEHGDSPEA
jgi:hypothetical protein